MGCGDQDAILDVLDNYVLDGDQEIKVLTADKLLAAVKVMSGVELPESTNIRMEMRAAIEAIRAFRLSEAELYTDCEFMANSVNQGWLSNWQKRGWHKKGGASVANRELWEEFLAVKGHKVVRFHHIAAHTNGSDFTSRVNSFCDELARGRARLGSIVATQPDCLETTAE